MPRRLDEKRPRRVLSGHRGQGMVEYALIVALLAVVVTVVVVQVGQRTSSALCQVNGGLGARNGRCSIVAMAKAPSSSKAHMYVMNLDGSLPADITNSDNDDQSPVFSPDGNRVAFSSHRSGAQFAIFTARTDGSGVAQVTTDAAHNDVDPAWSPDGTRLVFSRSGLPGFVTPATLRSQLYTIKVDGTDGTGGAGTAVPTGSQSTDYSDARPTWSPDGGRLAFDSTQAGTGKFDIFTVNATGGTSTRLTNAGAAVAANYRPDWSPDGRRIVYGNVATSGQWEVFIMNADGSGQADISNNAALFTGFDYYPVWMRDGGSILFVSDRTGGVFDIYRMNPDGTGVIRLTTFNQVAMGFTPLQPGP